MCNFIAPSWRLCEACSRDAMRSCGWGTSGRESPMNTVTKRPTEQWPSQLTIHPRAAPRCNNQKLPRARHENASNNAGGPPDQAHWRKRGSAKHHVQNDARTQGTAKHRRAPRSSARLGAEERLSDKQQRTSKPQPRTANTSDDEVSGNIVGTGPLFKGHLWHSVPAPPSGPNCMYPSVSPPLCANCAIANAASGRLCSWHPSAACDAQHGRKRRRR